jgi:hypothetical protein
MVGTSFAFARSSLFLVFFYVIGQDAPDPQAIDGEACTPIIDAACTPTYITLLDINLSVMRSMSTSFIDSSIVLSYSDIHARG